MAPSTGIQCIAVSAERPDWNGSPSRICHVSLDIPSGAVCGFIGPDGCGKGLLLYLIGLLEQPEQGEIRISGENLHQLPEEQRTQRRNQEFGFLFASSCLLPAFTVAENLAMPLFRLRDISPEEVRIKIEAALQRVNIAALADTPSHALSPEDRYRVALARAILHHPPILIAVSPPHAETLLPLARSVAPEATILWSGDDKILPHCDLSITMHAGHITHPALP